MSSLHFLERAQGSELDIYSVGSCESRPLLDVEDGYHNGESVSVQSYLHSLGAFIMDCTRSTVISLADAQLVYNVSVCRDVTVYAVSVHVLMYVE